MIITFKTFQDLIKDKSVLIVGGGPSAADLGEQEYEAHDVIVRINNFKYANKCKRTDIWYSYFGRNIKNVEQRVQEENIKALVCKYPVNQEHCWVYELNKELWSSLSIPVCIPTIVESFQTNNPFDISPTAGFAAIFNILAAKPKELTITGFDFFESGLHNLNEEWDASGNHIPSLEKGVVNVLMLEDFLTWV